MQFCTNVAVVLLPTDGKIIALNVIFTSESVDYPSITKLNYSANAGVIKFFSAFNINKGRITQLLTSSVCNINYKEKHFWLILFSFSITSLIFTYFRQCWLKRSNIILSVLCILGRQSYWWKSIYRTSHTMFYWSMVNGKAQITLKSAIKAEIMPFGNLCQIYYRESLHANFQNNWSTLRYFFKGFKNQDLDI